MFSENKDLELASLVKNDTALACAKAFKSENPFFILTIKPYLIYGRGRPCVVRVTNTDRSMYNWYFL